MNREAGQASVLFKAGALFSEQPRWTPDELRDLEARRGDVTDSCRARRDAVAVCARIEPSCVPLPAAEAWSVCSGRGAMCTEEYSREAGARLLEYPPQCTCVCAGDRNVIDWGKSPPP